MSETNDEYYRMEGSSSRAESLTNCWLKTCSLADTCLSRTQLFTIGFATDEVLIVIGHFLQFFFVFLTLGSCVSVALQTNVLANVIIVGIVCNCCLIIPFAIIFVIFKYRDSKDWLCFFVMLLAILTGIASIVVACGIVSGIDNNVKLAGSIIVAALGLLYLLVEAIVIIRSFLIDLLGRKCLTKTNEFRKKNGLRPLRWSQALCVIATPHSKRMASGKDKLGHDGFDKRVSRITFKTSDAAENVISSEASDPVKDAVDSWIENEGHKKNMSGDFSYCGIGVAKKDGKYYFTQLFAKKK
jgi:hypothetical protein